LKNDLKRRIVIDTNVLISAVFFKGKPDVILEAWKAGKLDRVLSEEILNEYSKVLDRLAIKFPSVDTSGILSVFTRGCIIVEPGVISNQICEDPDDDKFISAALGGASKAIISGDKHLLDVNGYSGREVLSPAEFIEKYLSEQANAAEQHDHCCQGCQLIRIVLQQRNENSFSQPFTNYITM
jgi:putative PIN family toxin of toxin-antitoxin system